MKLPLPLVLAFATSVGCAKTFDGDDGGGAAAPGTGGAGGGAAQCAEKACGAPCETCSEPPCNQVCDGNGECRSDFDVTCTACPDGDLDRPQTGADCPGVGLLCEYRHANDVEEFADCRAKALCTINGWEWQPEGYCYGWDPNATCPMVVPQHGSGCDRSVYTDMCAYGAGTFCTCTKCLSSADCQSGQDLWGCVSAPDEPCPVQAPLLGHACSEEGLACAYGACWLELSSAEGSELLTTTRVCEGGLWVDQPLACGG